MGRAVRFRWHGRRLVRRATAGSRVPPNFLIIGCQKAGTTSLAANLGRQPGIYVAPTETGFFIRNSGHSRSWYRSFFPTTGEIEKERIVAVGEKGPDYLVFPQVPAMVRRFDPEMKLLLILRDPVERALSHYFHEHDGGYEPFAFGEAIDAEPDRLAGEYDRMLAYPEYFSTSFLRYSYLTRGRYIEHIERWLQFFPREQLHVILLDDLMADPSGTLSATCAFVGAHDEVEAPDPQVRNTRSYPEMTDAMRLQLADYFRPWNEKLSAFLGRELPWGK
jgi:hypothetical protein